MNIEKYGIRLERLSEETLEQMRIWRNSDYVRSQMFFTEFISEEGHKKWFSNINNDDNYYFITYANNDPVGVINVKDIKNNVGEGGIFLISDKFENTDIVPRMVMCFNDFVFDIIKLDYIYSRVKRNNKKALSLSTAQGCIEVKEKSTESVVYFELRKETYEMKTKKIRNFLNKK